MKLNHTEFRTRKDNDRKNWRCTCTVEYKEEGKESNWRPSANGKTRKEAIENLTKKIEAKEAEIEKKSDLKENSLGMLEEELTRYFERKQNGELKVNNGNYKERSIYDKMELLKNLIKPYSISKIPVNKITREDVIKWQDELKKAGKSDKRRKGAYNLLTDYYTNYYCLEIDVNHISPASGLKFKKSKLEIGEKNVLNDSELRRYLDNCDLIGSKANILQFLVYTYCRVGEACTLKWEDWDGGKKLHIHSTWSKDKDGNSIVDRDEGKTRSSDRQIILNDQALNILHDQKKLQYGEADADGDGWIFPALKDNKKAMSHETVRNIHKRALDGIEKKIRIHDLRHTGITYAIRSSDNRANAIGIVSKLAGHSSITVTQDIYQAVLADDEALLVKDMSNALNNLRNAA